MTNPAIRYFLCLTLSLIFSGPFAEARTKSRPKPSIKASTRSTVKAVAKTRTKAASRAPAHAKGLGSLANMDMNRSLEVRGQTRNLSMMLVLKNGKENIDFVKVRQNYENEISSTEF